MSGDGFLQLGDRKTKGRLIDDVRKRTSISFSCGLALLGLLAGVTASGEESVIALAAPQCQKSYMSPVSSSFDQFTIAVTRASRANLQLDARDPIVDILKKSDSVRGEWLRVKSQIPVTQSRLSELLDDRMAFLQFFTYSIFLAREESGSFNLEHLEQYGITSLVVARSYEAIPDRFLEYLEESIIKAETGEPIVMTRPPFNLRNFLRVTLRGDPKFWAAAGHGILGQMRQGIDALCKVGKQE